MGKQSPQRNLVSYSDLTLGMRLTMDCNAHKRKIQNYYNDEICSVVLAQCSELYFSFSFSLGKDNNF